MKKIYHKLLKKFTVADIIKMRQMKRKGSNDKDIAKAFKCAVTTATWHTGNINSESYIIEVK